MALIKTDGRIVAGSTTRTSILHDIEYLIERVGKIAKGEVKFLDANMKQTSAALKRLQEAKGFLDTGLIPTNQE
jgi:cytochrome c556